MSSIISELAELLLILEELLREEIKADSKVTCGDIDIEVPLAISTTNAASIDFLPQNALEMQLFSQLLGGNNLKTY